MLIIGVSTLGVPLHAHLPHSIAAFSFYKLHWLGVWDYSCIALAYGVGRAQASGRFLHFQLGWVSQV